MWGIGYLCERCANNNPPFADRVPRDRPRGTAGLARNALEMLRFLTQRQPVWVAARGLAKKAKKGEGAPTRQAAEAPSSPVVVGLNILKDGQDPELRPDSEYPEWIWTLHQERPTLQALKTRHEEDPESLSQEEQRRLFKLWNRSRIKENNAELKK